MFSLILFNIVSFTVHRSMHLPIPNCSASSTIHCSRSSAPQADPSSFSQVPDSSFLFHHSLTKQKLIPLNVIKGVILLVIYGHLLAPVQS